jgi:hypothetical protein
MGVWSAEGSAARIASRLKGEFLRTLRLLAVINDVPPVYRDGSQVRKGGSRDDAR